MSAKITNVLFQTNNSRVLRQPIKVGGLHDFSEEERLS